MAGRPSAIARRKVGILLVISQLSASPRHGHHENRQKYSRRFEIVARLGRAVYAIFGFRRFFMRFEIVASSIQHQPGMKLAPESAASSHRPI